MNKKYYEHNSSYSNFLNQGDISTFEVYTSAIKKYVPIGGSSLDVGCGPGLVVDYLTRQKINATGIEISKTSIAIAKKRKGKFQLYDGRKIPFANNTFDVVSNMDVLEHVQDVDKFLLESKRVLKPGGHLIICAPNFMSLTSSHHYRTSGLVAKIVNIGLFLTRVITYFFGEKVLFGKIVPIEREDFHPDDDATNLINPLDLFKWGVINKMKLIQYSGSILPKSYPSHFVGQIPFVNLFTGGVFVVLQK